MQADNSQTTDRNPLDISLMLQLQHTVPASGASSAPLNTKKIHTPKHKWAEPTGNQISSNEEEEEEYSDPYIGVAYGST